MQEKLTIINTKHVDKHTVETYWRSNFNPINCLPIRATAGRPHVRLCPKFLVIIAVSRVMPDLGEPCHVSPDDVRMWTLEFLDDVEALIELCENICHGTREQDVF